MQGEVPSFAKRLMSGGLAVTMALSGGCSKTESAPEYTMAEAHFSATCPTGEMAAITEIAYSGVLPINPANQKRAWGVIRLECFPNGVHPAVVQDKERGGICLGYNKEQHLTLSTRQPGQQAPEFFANSTGEIGVTGSNNIEITRANIHSHDLTDPWDKAQYQQNNCG